MPDLARGPGELSGLRQPCHPMLPAPDIRERCRIASENLAQGELCRELRTATGRRQQIDIGKFGIACGPLIYRLDVEIGLLGKVVNETEIDLVILRLAVVGIPAAGGVGVRAAQLYRRRQLILCIQFQILIFGITFGQEAVGQAGIGVQHAKLGQADSVGTPAPPTFILSAYCKPT